MSDTFGWSPSTDTSFSRRMEEIIEEISVASAAGDQAEVAELISLAQSEIKEYTSQTLAKEYRDAYKSAGHSKLSKQARDSSYRIRNRAFRNANSALNDIQSWADKNVEIDAIIRDRRKAQEFLEQQLALTRTGTAQQRARARQLVEEAQKVIDNQTKNIERLGGSTGNDPEVLYRRRRKGRGGQTRGTIAARRDAKEYFQMVERSAARDIANDAYIKGQKDAGVEWFAVSDGVDCGWTSHRDPDKANGRIVHIDEVILSAHPNCQRTFQALPDGPRGKKTDRLLEGLTGLRADQLGQVAKGTIIAGYTFQQLKGVYESPLTTRVIRAILENKEIALGPSSKKILHDWANKYESNEGRAVAARGWTDNAASRSRIQVEAMASMGRKLENRMDASPFTSVALSRQERTVLGVRAKEISLGDLDSRYADYTDYLRHMRDLDAPVLRSVGAAAQDESVLRELYGTGYRFRTMTRLHRGSEVFNNWKKAVRAVDDLMRGVDPFTGKNTAARAQVDLVRLAARTIDPLPWLYATANVPGGLLRASVGMTSAGRQDLAQQLYLRMKGPEFREKFNRRYMRNQLGEFPAPISIRPQDIYEALIPRISFLGDGPLNFTLYAERGKIIPAVHVLPQSAYMRQLGLRWRLASNGIEDMVTGYRDWNGTLRGYLAKELRELPEDMIWTVDVFRNGPIQASMRLLHDGVDTYGLRLKPQNRQFRSAFKTYVREAGEELEPIREIVLMPKAWGGYTLNPYEVDKLELIVGLATLREGSLAEVARVAGVEYRRLLAVLDIHTQKYGERVGFLVDKLRDYAGANVEYGNTALRIEQIRQRGKNFLDEFLVTKAEPSMRVVRDYSIVKFDRASEIVYGKLDVTKPKVRYVYRKGQATWSTVASGMEKTKLTIAKTVQLPKGSGAKVSDGMGAIGLNAPESMTLEKFEELMDWVYKDSVIPVEVREFLIDVRFTAERTKEYVQTRVKVAVTKAGDAVATVKHTITSFFDADMTDFVREGLVDPEIRAAARLPSDVRLQDYRQDFIRPSRVLKGFPGDASAATTRLYLEDMLPDKWRLLESIDDRLMEPQFRRTLAQVLDTHDYMEKRGLWQLQAFRDNGPSFEVWDDAADFEKWAYQAAHFQYGARTKINPLWGSDYKYLADQYGEFINGGHMYNAGDEAALIMHEMGHYVTFNLFSTKDRLDLWNTIVKSLPVNQRRSRSTRSSLSVADRDRLLVKGEFYDLLDEDPDAWFEWLDDGRGPQYIDIHNFDFLTVAMESPELAPFIQSLGRHMQSRYSMQDWKELYAEMWVAVQDGLTGHPMLDAYREFMIQKGIMT